MDDTRSEVVRQWNLAFGQSAEGRKAQILTSRDAEYEEARQIYNRYHDLYPAVIVRSMDAAFLSEAIDFASDNGVPLAVRGGGHHIGGFSSCQNGVVIDLSPFRAVCNNAVESSVAVGPGARLSDVDSSLWRYGKVLPLGTVSQTGVAGLTLGGGIGWLVGQFGLTCDNLIGADVLLPSGELVKAESPGHEDLLWGLRGGGGGFGIALEFRYRTHHKQPFFAGSASISAAKAYDTFGRLIDFLEEECPPSLTISPSISRVRGGEVNVQVDFCSWGEERESLEKMLGLLQPYRMEGTGSDFPFWQQAFDNRFLPPMRGYWKSRYTQDISLGDISLILGFVAKAPPSNVSVSLEHLHGAFHATTEDTSAFPLRSCNYGLLISSRWPAKEDDAACIDWTRRLYGELDPAATSLAYVNYASHDDARPMISRARTGAARLRAAKLRYDPENKFRRNHVWRTT